MHKLTGLTVAIIVGTSTLVACASDKPSASDWAAKVIKVCDQLEADRLVAAKELPSDAAPTVEQLMAFYTGFAPKFTAYAKQIKALERPSGLGSEIDEFVAALDAAAEFGQRSATDVAVAEAQLNDSTPAEFARLEAASVAAGVAKCNG